MKRSSALLIVPILLAALPPRAHAEDPAEILARAKEAAGGQAWDAVRTLHTRMHISTGGPHAPTSGKLSPESLAETEAMARAALKSAGRGRLLGIARCGPQG